MTLLGAYQEEETGFGDPSPVAGYEGIDEVSLWQCGDCDMQEAAMMAPQMDLPFWQGQDEEPEATKCIFGYHTEHCSEFQLGFCKLHRLNGRNSSGCFCYHFDSQHRRPPVDEASGHILYWDTPCPHQYSNESCPSGDECIFAHNREEISYHPAKYKTRRCNGKGCRGESICCFAHTEEEVRSWAPERYSYWAIMANTGNGRGAVSSHLDTTDAWQDMANEEWQRPYPMPQLPPSKHKLRFCASYPNVSQCRRGAACAFAHSREEARTPLLTIEQEEGKESALTPDFFMYHFKTLWCPIGVQHDWQTCVYAHNYQDARRKVSIGYGPRQCPYWSKKDASCAYSQRCPLGLRCPHSHGAKEQLYHPLYFRSVICRDLRSGICPRQKLCAFFHNRRQLRKDLVDRTDYNIPLKEEDLAKPNENGSDWVADFLSPPFRDNGNQGCDAQGVAQMELGPMEEDGGYGYQDQAGGSGNDNRDYWCNPGAYWTQNGELLDIAMEGYHHRSRTTQNKLLDIAMEGYQHRSRTWFEGMCTNVLEPDLGSGAQQDEEHRGMLGVSGLPISRLYQEGAKYNSNAWRFSMPSPAKFDEIADGSPRNSDEGDAADDASTSAGGEFLASTGSLLSQAATGRSKTWPVPAGAIGKTSGSTAGSASSASSSPWMIPSSQEPSWGPFGGAFDGYHGMLSAVPVDAPSTLPPPGLSIALPPGLMNSSSLWRIQLNLPWSSDAQSA
jgi:hypothetical protein